MKLKKQLITAIALFGLTTSFAQKSNIDKDIKMYSQLWDDVMNKGKI